MISTELSITITAAVPKPDPCSFKESKSIKTESQMDLGMTGTEDPPGMIPSCAEGGVLGALAGAMGSLQATEILKEIMAIGDSMAGSLLIYDALGASFQKMKMKPDPNCPLCGIAPTITDLSGHVVEAQEG